MHCEAIESAANGAVDQSSWYAIYTRHHHEKTVAQILTMKGFETLLPLYTTNRRWKDRTKVLALPLFPCYVFIKGGFDRRLDILTTPGTYALVSSAGRPTAIPPNDIEAIRRVLESGVRAEPYPFLKRGERVRVKCGPLQGVHGILVRKKNLWRLVLSVEMLGKSAAVEVDASVVEKVNPSSRFVEPLVGASLVRSLPDVKDSTSSVTNSSYVRPR
jgi:transcription antitermination factor NusG